MTAEAVAAPAPAPSGVPGHTAVIGAGSRALERDDPMLASLLEGELRHQRGTLAMVASSSVADPSVLAAGAAVLSNVTAEGYPGRRYHPGAGCFDEVESLAEQRARSVFAARFANVQPHSCSIANLSVLMELLPPGGRVLGLHLDAGGHLTHGASASVTGSFFDAAHYGVDSSGYLDYSGLARAARIHRPNAIIAGASAYPRQLDFARFRAIADEVGAYLIADISHIAGLVAAGAHPSPIDHAHVTTTSTYKQLGGPRGGLILCGRDADTLGPDGRTRLAAQLRRAVFPRSQGTPSPAAIAAKARALALVGTDRFTRTARRIVVNARELAAALTARGHQLLTGGTDNHMVVLDLRATGISGLIAERALEDCGILANRNRIPGDTRPAAVASGLRLGTNIAAQRGMGQREMCHCADLISAVLAGITPTSDTGYELGEQTRTAVRKEIARLCAQFPLPGYAPGRAGEGGHV